MLMHLHCSFLVKIVEIFALLVCKIVCPKIRSCKFFDKYQVCTYHLLNNLKRKKDGKRRGHSRALYYWNLLTAYQPNWHLIFLSLDEIYGTIQWRSLFIVTIKSIKSCNMFTYFLGPAWGSAYLNGTTFPQSHTPRVNVSGLRY